MLNNLLTSYPFKPLSDKQREGLEFLIKKLGSSVIKDLRQQAYVIATIRHETADTYHPVKEYGSLHYLQSKPYYPYIGFGYVQLTWKENYKRFGELLRIDLIEKPELALDPEISWKITELGMSKGLFTGKKLDDYFNDEITDYYHARKIINRLDKAIEISELAQKIYHTISRIEDIPKERI